MKYRLALALAVAAIAISSTSSAKGAVVFSKPFSNSGGDRIDRGFYIPSYPSDNLGTVQLNYAATNPGTYGTSLTVRLGTYDGTIVGSTQSITTSLPGGTTAGDFVMVTYDFGGVAVPLGGTLTFTQQLNSGPDLVFYDVGAPDPLGPVIVETEGTTPPLDTFRRDTVGITITSVPEPTGLALLVLGGAAILARRGRPI